MTAKSDLVKVGEQITRVALASGSGTPQSVLTGFMSVNAEAGTCNLAVQLLEINKLNKNNHRVIY